MVSGKFENKSILRAGKRGDLLFTHQFYNFNVELCINNKYRIYKIWVIYYIAIVELDDKKLQDERALDLY